MDFVRRAQQRLAAWLDSRELASLRRLLVALVLIVGGGLITHGTHSGTGDQPHYMMAARSLAFDFDLDLANDYGDPSNVVYDGHLVHEAHARPGQDGRLRPVHDVGLPVLAAPYFAVAYRLAERVDLLPAGLLKRARLNRWVALKQLLSLGMLVVTGLLAGQIFELALGLCTDRARSFGLAALLALSPPLLSHAYLFFTEIPTAWLALWIWNAPRRPRSSAKDAWLGFVTGGLLLIHARNAGLTAGLVVVAARRALRQGQPSHLLVYGSGLLAALALRTAVNLHLWGTWLTNPHASFGEPGTGLLSETALRLAGWLFDQEHGLLLQAPLYVLVLPALLRLRREFPEAFREIMILAGLYLLVMSSPILNRHGWRGGWSPPARFLVPLAPLLGATLATLVRPLLPRPILAVFLVQALLDVFLWQHPKLMFDDGDGVGVFLTFVGTRVGIDLASWFPSWGSWGMAPALRSLALAAGGVVLAWLSLRVPQRPVPP